VYWMWAPGVDLGTVCQSVLIVVNGVRGAAPATLAGAFQTVYNPAGIGLPQIRGGP
jgi:hypothetical protein